VEIQQQIFIILVWYRKHSRSV